MRTSIPLAILLTMLSGTGWSASAVPDAWPAWLKDAMLKEGKLTGGQPLSFSQDRLTLLAPAKVIGQASVEEDLWYFAMDIGAEAPMECWATYEGVDAAAFTQSIAEANMDGLGEAHGGVVNKAILGMEVGAQDSAATLSVDWFYTVGKPQAAKAALVKVNTADFGDSAVTCSHNELGYRDTFDSAFRNIVDSVSVTEAFDPFHVALYLMSVHGRVVGFNRQSMSRDSEGDIRYYEVESTLVPVDETTMSTSDSVRLGWSRPDGSLINKVNTSAENGALVTNLRLDPIEGGWQVSGTHQGKAMDVTIDHDAPVLSSFGQTQEVQRMIQSGGSTSTQFPTWLVDADPTRFVAFNIAIDDTETGTMTIGPLTMTAEFDNTGTVRHASSTVAGSEIELKLVWEQGTPVLPE